jgi:hypothetical protein
VVVVNPVENETAYWKARSLALQEKLDAAHARLLALARSAPFEAVTLFGYDPAALSRRAGTADIFAGWEDTTYVRTAGIATELRQLWERLDSSPASER